MDKRQSRRSLLAEVELEALEAGREWTRRRIERNLQKLADKDGRISPLRRGCAGSPPSDAHDHPDVRGGR
jgi:hypothetical protein